MARQRPRPRAGAVPVNAPQFVNDRIRAPRPAPARYTDKPPIRIRRGTFATQVSQASRVLYDSMLHSRNTLYTAAEISGFTRIRRSSHQFNELAKGLIDVQPLLLGAEKETFADEMTWQMMQASGAANTPPPSSWHDTMLILRQHRPTAAIQSATSKMVKWDYDTELRLNVPYWDRLTPGLPPLTTAAERRARVRMYSRRHVQATMRSAMTQATTANALARRARLRRAPVIHVQSTGGHLGRGTRVLTQAEILGI